MNRIIFSFLILLLFISFSYADSSMGIRPPAHQYIFTGQEEFTGNFIVMPGEEKTIRVYPVGDLAEYVYFKDGKKEIEVTSSDSFTVTYFLRLPKDLKPGNYRLKLVAEQVITPEYRIEHPGFARAFAAMAFVVSVRVPNEGKFLETKMVYSPKKINSGDTAYFNIEMLNFGTEDLYNLWSEIVISDPEGNMVAAKKTTKVDHLGPGSTGELRTYFDTEGYGPGAYMAEASIDYGGSYPAEPSVEFRVGDVFIKIINVTWDLSGSIGKFFIEIESQWNEELTDVYAELIVRDGEEIKDTFKTSSRNVGPWRRVTLEGFWEKSSVLPGEYDVEIFVYYYDKLAQKQVRVEIEEEKASPMNQTVLLLIGLGILGLILIINAVWFYLSLSRKKPKKSK